MTQGDWERYLDVFERSSDAVVVAVGQQLAKVYRDPKLAPPTESLQQADDIALAVRTQFPTQFAEGFEGWVGASQAFSDALQAGDAGKISVAFQSAFGRLYHLWMRLVNFLPFLLMISVNRLKSDLVKEHAGKELKAALQNFDRFYAREDEQQREGDQRRLIENLLKFYRRLDTAEILGEEFVFHPLLGPVGGFGALFPTRFEAQLELIQEVRNKVQHDELAERPKEVLEPLTFLLRVSVLDLIALLRPICAHYYLVFMTKTDAEAVAGLAFSGLEPSRVEFLLPPPPSGGRPDADTIKAGELYLIRRGRERFDHTPPETLLPPEYLDLTPFLIHEGARFISSFEAPEPQSSDDRLIFIFRRYRQRSQELAYREFAGRRDWVIEHFEQAFRALRVEIDKFSLELERFKEGTPEGGAVTPKLVLEMTWRVSSDHLRTVMNPTRYDANGAPGSDGDDGAQRSAFTEDLFVAPGEASRIEGFFTSRKRGLAIVGGSGIGKSNLLCHFFLRERRAGRPCLFLAARNLRDPDLLAFLEQVAKRIDRSWRLRHLAAFVGQQGQPLTVFVDAVNEYSGPGGPADLLEKLIAVAQDDTHFKPLRLVFTCRSEVWDDYRGDDTSPLDSAVFFTADAFRLEGFDDVRRRAELFSAYQKFFNLRPETYQRLAPSVQSLIRHPFMLAMVAETYSNQPDVSGVAPLPGRVIPRDLDYFELFTHLTRRKLDDARWLDRRGKEVLPSLIEGCLYQFARLLFRRLAEEDATPDDDVPVVGRAARTTAGLGDGVRRSRIDEDPDFQTFLKVGRAGSQISAFDATLQVGLLEMLLVEELDSLLTPRQGRIYKFFHDQYSQYWLAAVYNKEVLRVIKGETLGAPELTRLVEKITDLIHRSATAPVLAGAIDHWLHSNMRLPPSNGGDLLLPLLNGLSESDSGAVRHYVRSFLVSLLVRRIVAPDILYQHLFREGNRALCIGMAEAFDVMEAGAGLPPELFRQFLDSCSDEHAEAVIERLADIFAQRFSVSSRGTLQYLDRALDSLAGLPAAKAVIRLRSLIRRQVPFLLRFSYFAVVGAFGQPYTLGRLVGFARRKYSLVLNAIVRSREPSIRGRGLTGGVVRLLYGPLEAHGAGLWRRFGAAMSLSGNDRLFVANDGVVQRDVVYEFLPYAVALHNGDVASASLAPGSPFRQLIIRMLSFRVTSVIGYFAVVVLPVLLIRQWAVVEGIIDDLIVINTPSCRYFGPLLLVNLSYADQTLSERCLRLLHKKILPWFQSHNYELEYELDWLVVHSFGIAATDVRTLWPSCAGIVESVFQHLERGQDEPTIARCGDELAKASFFDPALGERLLAMMLDRGSLDHPLWRTCTLKVMAGLLARSPSMLDRLLKDRGIGESVEREARRFLTETLIQARDVLIGQVTQNRFLVRAMVSDARLRYLIVKVTVGGLAQSNSERDFVKEIRRFTVELVAAYLGDRNDDRQYGTLSVEETLAEAQSRRILGHR